MHAVNMPDWVVERGRMMNHFPTIDIGKTALLVVDMQNAFIVPGQPVANPTTAEIIPNINRLAEAMRHKGGPVLWSRHTYTDVGPGALPDWQLENGTRTAQSREALSAGNFGHALHADLNVADEDIVFDKYRYSCFYNAAIDLDAALRESGIDTLIVTGTVTNCCCQTSAQDAVMRGYKVLFLSDATAALSDLEHNSALVSLRIAFADVRTTDETLQLIKEAAGRRVATPA